MEYVQRVFVVLGMRVSKAITHYEPIYRRCSSMHHHSDVCLETGLSRTRCKLTTGVSLSTVSKTVEGFLCHISESIWSLMVGTLLWRVAKRLYSSCAWFPCQRTAHRPWLSRVGSSCARAVVVSCKMLRTRGRLHFYSRQS